MHGTIPSLLRETQQERHPEFNGANRPRIETTNLDKYYPNEDENGMVELDVEERVVPNDGEALIDLELFSRWSTNSSFEVACALQAWLQEQRRTSQEGADWDLVRRGVASLYAPRMPGACS